MTTATLLHYIEIGLAFAAVMAPTVGAIGHALAALPWTWAKTIGNVLNAISVDFGDLKNALQNAKLGPAANVAGALKSGALVPIGGDKFQTPPGTEKKIASVAPPPAGLGLMCIAWLAFGAAASLMSVSCAEAPTIIKDVASVIEAAASLYQADGANWLSLVADTAAPLADPVLKSELQAAVAQGRINLLDASKLVASKGAITQQELDDAYKDFRATAGIIADLIQQAGLPASRLKATAAGAPQPAPAPFPLPLAVTQFKGSAQ